MDRHEHYPGSNLSDRVSVTCAAVSTTYAAAMKPPRRVGAVDSNTRAIIVEAAEAVIRNEGYAAASSRRVAQHAGVKPSLVHYYFPTTEDLYLAVFREGAAHSDAMIEKALASENPLLSLWAFFSDTTRTALALEFMAMANRHENIRKEMALHSEAMRTRQAEALETAIGGSLFEATNQDAKALSLVLAGP